MAGGGIINGEGGGNFLAGNIVERTEVDMEVSSWIKNFCGNIWVMCNLGSLGNNTSTSIVVDFGG